jgi:hypothetical protein
VGGRLEGSREGCRAIYNEKLYRYIYIYIFHSFEKMFEWTLTWTYYTESFLLPFFSYSFSPTPDKTIGDGACRKTFRRVEEKYIQLLFKREAENFFFVCVSCVCASQQRKCFSLRPVMEEK